MTKCIDLSVFENEIDTQKYRFDITLTIQIDGFPILDKIRVHTQKQRNKIMPVQIDHAVGVEWELIVQTGNYSSVQTAMNDAGLEFINVKTDGSVYPNTRPYRS